MAYQLERILRRCWSTASELREGFPSADALAEGFRQHPQPGRLPSGSSLGMMHQRWPREIAVARHYFDIGDGAQSMRDDEGTEFDSLDAAVQAAARSAAEIGTGRLAKGDTSDVVIVVRNEQNQRVCTVRASMEIERHSPPPQDPHPWSA
jgi:hypothetical protein